MFYMCWVEGREGATHKHEFFETALAEAKRLAALPGNTGRRVHVLQSIGTVITTIKVESEYIPYWCEEENSAS